MSSSLEDPGPLARAALAQLRLPALLAATFLCGPISGLFAVETSDESDTARSEANTAAVAPPDASVANVSWILEASRTTMPERGANVFLRARVDVSKAISK